MVNQKKEGAKKAIFVVEDDVFLVKVYKVKFEDLGVAVWVATDGAEALAFLEREPPNVVLLDIMLPGMSGFDVLAAMKKNERWKNVPVLILSNLGQEQDLERGKALGAKEYIVKANVKIDEVVERVKKYIHMDENSVVG